MADSALSPASPTPGARNRERGSRGQIAHARPDAYVPPLSVQFDDREQARDSYTLGMWVFLATEVLFFGGIIAAYSAYRLTWPAAFAIASQHTVYWIGTVNTAVLLSSSLFMALAVHAARDGRRKALVGYLCLTFVLGALFLGLKGLEYWKDYADGFVPWIGWHYVGPHPMQVEVFWILYFFLTGLHGLHVSIGVCLIATLAAFARRGRYGSEHYIPVELIGLYWHFVDIVWVFLYPFIYLAGTRTHL